MSAVRTAAVRATSRPATAVGPAALLQRKCACGGAGGLGGECEKCRRDKLLGKPLQRKLAVGAASDEAEREADRVAEAAVRSPPSGRGGLAGALALPLDPPRIRRRAGPAAFDAAGAVQDPARPEPVEGRAEPDPALDAADAPPIVHEVLASPGQPLDAAARDFFEPRLGRDLGAVRVHADARAAESARSVDALAYTVGSHVVMGPGAPTWGSPASRRLVAHELAHVAQQGGARLLPPGAGPALAVEPHARQVARQAADGAAPSAAPSAAPGARLARLRPVTRAELPPALREPTPETAVETAVRVIGALRAATCVEVDRCAVMLEGRTFFLHPKVLADETAALLAQVTAVVNGQRSVAGAVEAELERVRAVTEQHWITTAAAAWLGGAEDPTREVHAALSEARRHLAAADAAPGDVGVALRSAELAAEQLAAADQRLADYKQQLSMGAERVAEGAASVRRFSMGIVIGVGTVLLLPEAVAAAGVVGGGLALVGAGAQLGGTAEGAVNVTEQLIDRQLTGEALSGSELAGSVRGGVAQGGGAALSGVVGGGMTSALGEASTLGGAMWRGVLSGSASSGSQAAFQGVVEGRSAGEIGSTTAAAVLEGALSGPFGGAAGHAAEGRGLAARVALEGTGGFTGSWFAATAAGKSQQEAFQAGLADALGSVVGAGVTPAQEHAPATEARTHEAPSGGQAHPEVDEAARAEGEGLAGPDGEAAPRSVADALSPQQLEAAVAVSSKQAITTWTERAREARWVDVHPEVVETEGGELRAPIGEDGEHEIVKRRDGPCERRSGSKAESPCPLLLTEALLERMSGAFGGRDPAARPARVPTLTLEQVMPIVAEAEARIHPDMESLLHEGAPDVNRYTVYLFFNARGELLKAGQTLDLPTRVAQNLARELKGEGQVFVRVLGSGLNDVQANALEQAVKKRWKPPRMRKAPEVDPAAEAWAKQVVEDATSAGVFNPAGQPAYSPTADAILGPNEALTADDLLEDRQLYNTWIRGQPEGSPQPGRYALYLFYDRSGTMVKAGITTAGRLAKRIHENVSREDSGTERVVASAAHGAPSEQYVLADGLHLQLLSVDLNGVQVLALEWAIAVRFGFTDRGNKLDERLPEHLKDWGRSRLDALLAAEALPPPRPKEFTANMRSLKRRTLGWTLQERASALAALAKEKK